MYAFKSADTTRSNTDVLASDPDLQFSGLVPGRYALLGFLQVDGVNLGGFRFGFLCDPAPAEVSKVTVSMVFASSSDESSSGADISDAPVATQFDMETGVNVVLLAGALVLETDPSDLAFQWAQKNADASDLSLLQGSWLSIVRMG